MGVGALDGDAFDTKMRNHLEHSSWVISPTHGPLQQAIFFVVNASMGEACMLHTDGHAAWSLASAALHGEFRAYIAALQTYAVPGREQRAASTRAFIIPAARHRLLGQGSLVTALIYIGHRAEILRWEILSRDWSNWYYAVTSGHRALDWKASEVVTGWSPRLIPIGPITWQYFPPQIFRRGDQYKSMRPTPPFRIIKAP